MGIGAREQGEERHGGTKARRHGGGRKLRNVERGGGGGAAGAGRLLRHCCALEAQAPEKSKLNQLEHPEFHRPGGGGAGSRL